MVQPYAAQIEPLINGTIKAKLCALTRFKDCLICIIIYATLSRVGCHFVGTVTIIAIYCHRCISVCVPACAYSVVQWRACCSVVPVCVRNTQYGVHCALVCVCVVSVVWWCGVCVYACVCVHLLTDDD